jgi:organic hydroperoxide reductase OsmC/OhrA
MRKTHHYSVSVRWTGNGALGPSALRSYDQRHEIVAVNKPSIAGSCDPAFRDHRTRWNPEELLVAALSACHQACYLELCADAGIVVVAYSDDAEGFLEELPDGSRRFHRVVLRPTVTLRPGADCTEALVLHREAHSQCIIANSVSFPVENRPQVDGC